jgi:hypothetical protein
MSNEDPDDPPGVPGFRSWRAVYGFVFAAFILLVIALTLFSRAYA